LQLENQYRLFDYSINVNDVVQLMVRETVSNNESLKISSPKVSKNVKEETPTPSCSSAISSSDEVNI